MHRRRFMMTGVAAAAGAGMIASFTSVRAEAVWVAVSGPGRLPVTQFFDSRQSGQPARRRRSGRCDL